MSESSEGRSYQPRNPYDRDPDRQSDNPTYGAITGEDNLGDLHPAAVVLPGFSDHGSLTDALIALVAADLFMFAATPLPIIMYDPRKAGEYDRTAQGVGMFDELRAYRRRQHLKRLSAMRTGELFNPDWRRQNAVNLIRYDTPFSASMEQSTSPHKGGSKNQG